MKVSTLLLAIIFSCFSGFTTPGGNNEHVIALVGNHKIKLADFTSRYSSFIFSSGSNDNIITRQAILNNMINEILLKDYDNNEQVYNNPEYQIELDWTRNQAILAYLKDLEIYDKITATEEEIREAFQRMNQQISARHLYAETEEEANYLYELLRTGVDFDNLAAQVFKDSTLRNNGGYLGSFTWGDMDPAFEDAAFLLKPGEISTPVKTAQGYSIIKVEDVISNPIVTEYQFLQKKLQIESAIKIYKRKPAERAYLSNLVDINKIKFNENILQEILTGYSGLQNNETSKLSLTEAECAEYEGKVFKSSYVEQKIDQLPENQKQRINSLESLKAVITGFIIQDELLKVASHKGFDENEKVKELFVKMSDNLFFKFKRKEIFDKVDITDKEVLEFYLKNIYMFTKEPEINIREILVKEKSLADSLLQELNSGKSFDELARKFSVREWSAENGGEMGYAPASVYGMLKEKFWNEPVGTLIGPVQVENLYGIFTVIGKINGQPVKFDLVKSEAADLLKQEKGKEILQGYVERLKAKVKIEINEKLLLSSDVAVAE